MCPICREPVTFGGGITIENTGPGWLASARKRFSFTQHSAQRFSICFGSYALAISRAMPAKFSCRYADSGACCVIFDYTGSQVGPSNQPTRQHYSGGGEDVSRRELPNGYFLPSS